MWAQTQTHQPVPDRPGEALPRLHPVPFATPPRAAGAAAAAATASTGEPSFAPPSGQPPSAPGSEGTFLLVDDPPAPGIRDSFASIVDDPFFLRYHTPDPEPDPDPTDPDPTSSELNPGPGPRSALSTSAGHRTDNEERQPWIPPRKESLSDTNPTPWVRTHSIFFFFLFLFAVPCAEPRHGSDANACLETRAKENGRG